MFSRINVVYKLRGAASSPVSTYICVSPVCPSVAECGRAAHVVCATRLWCAAHLVKSCPYYSLSDLNIVK